MYTMYKYYFLKVKFINGIICFTLKITYKMPYRNLMLLYLLRSHYIFLLSYCGALNGTDREY